MSAANINATNWLKCVYCLSLLKYKHNIIYIEINYLFVAEWACVCVCVCSCVYNVLVCVHACIHRFHTCVLTYRNTNKHVVHIIYIYIYI